LVLLENFQEKKERAKKIFVALKKHCPETGTALNYPDSFALLVAVILSAQCTDERVNAVTKELFKNLKTPEDFANVPQEELEKLIYSTGFYRAKAKNIRQMAKKIVSDFNGSVPASMHELLSLRGVARKTANVVLQEAFGKVEGIVVDTHIKRVSYRLGLTTTTNPEKAEKELMEIFPKTRWLELGGVFIRHGRKVCHSRKPGCGKCVVKSLCPSSFGF
jgi:endonuclease III